MFMYSVYLGKVNYNAILTLTSYEHNTQQRTIAKCATFEATKNTNLYLSMRVDEANGGAVY